jgi:arylsulfatase A-like enzyme
MKNNMPVYLLLLLFGFSIQAQEKKSKNVLFIIVDDLRPVLPTYGADQIVAPNITAFSENAVQFNNTFVNIPTCGASRASILTGIRPSRNYFMKYTTSISNDMPDAITFPGLLKNNGYTTISNGKISHNRDDMTHTWSEIWRPKGKFNNQDYVDPKSSEALEKEGLSSVYPFERLDVADTSYKDGKIANKAVEDLKKLKKSGKPFLLAVGFLKPHLPFNAPSKYWDYYEEEDIQLPVNNTFSRNGPKSAGNWYEMVKYKGIPKNNGNDAKNAATFTLDEDFAKQLIHGYYACVSFTDAQIGKVLDALDELGLSDDTIVVFTSDHGFSLMEHNRWSKHNLFNVENRVPLMIRVPGLTQKSQSQSYVELIDLYPTIAELVGLKTPERVEGTSLVKNLKDPSLISKSVGYSRIWNGDMVVSPNYLYAEWRRNKEGNVYDNMLYDLKADSLEMNNIADQPKYRKLVDSLSQQIKLKPVQ